MELARLAAVPAAGRSPPCSDGSCSSRPYITSTPEETSGILYQHAMNALHYAGRLYSLDTLDSRFTSSSRTPPSKLDPARPSPDDPGYTSIKKRGSGGEKIIERDPPSRWKTPEYLYHGLVFLVAVPLMFKTVYDLSKRK